MSALILCDRDIRHLSETVCVSVWISRNCKSCASIALQRDCWRLCLIPLCKSRHLSSSNTTLLPLRLFESQSRHIVRVYSVSPYCNYRFPKFCDETVDVSASILYYSCWARVPSNEAVDAPAFIARLIHSCSWSLIYPWDHCMFSLTLLMPIRNWLHLATKNASPQGKACVSL